jgi:hypothetical protein
MPLKDPAYVGTVIIGNNGSIQLADGTEIISTSSTGALTTPNQYVWKAGKENNAGGSATVAITVTGVLTTDVVFAAIQASTNAVTIQKVTPTANTITVIASGDPGASTVIAWQVVRDYQ